MTSQQCPNCHAEPPFDACPSRNCARLAHCTREREAAEAWATKVQGLLIESRKWQALGEFGDPLGPECWTPEYRDYMTRLDAAIAGKVIQRPICERGDAVNLARNIAQYGSDPTSFGIQVLARAVLLMDSYIREWK